MKIQIDDVVRDATPEEEANIKNIQDKCAIEKKEIEAKAAAKVSAIAKLAALGLTTDEINGLIS